MFEVTPLENTSHALAVASNLQMHSVLLWNISESSLEPVLKEALRCSRLPLAFRCRALRRDHLEGSFAVTPTSKVTTACCCRITVFIYRSWQVCMFCKFRTMLCFHLRRYRGSFFYTNARESGRSGTDTLENTSHALTVTPTTKEISVCCCRITVCIYRIW